MKTSNVTIIDHNDYKKVRIVNIGPWFYPQFFSETISDWLCFYFKNTQGDYDQIVKSRKEETARAYIKQAKIAGYFETDYTTKVVKEYFI